MRLALILMVMVAVTQVGCGKKKPPKVADDNSSGGGDAYARGPGGGIVIGDPLSGGGGGGNSNPRPAPPPSGGGNTNFVPGGGAVQNVRQAGRRTIALNDFHQLGIAIKQVEILDGRERPEPLLDVGELQEAVTRIAHQRAPPIWTRTRVPRPMTAIAIIASHVSAKLINAAAAGS